MRRETDSNTGYGVGVGCRVGRGCKGEETGEMREFWGEGEGCERGGFGGEMVEVGRVDGRIGGGGRGGEDRREEDWKENGNRE